MAAGVCGLMAVDSVEDLFRDGGGTSGVPELHSQSESPDHQGHCGGRSVVVAAEDLFQGCGGPPVRWRSTKLQPLERGRSAK